MKLTLEAREMSKEAFNLEDDSEEAMVDLTSRLVYLDVGHLIKEETYPISMQQCTVIFANKRNRKFQAL